MVATFDACGAEHFARDVARGGYEGDFFGGLGVGCDWHVQASGS